MAKLSKEKFYDGFKIIFGYLAPYRKTVFVLSVLSVVSAIFGSAIPYFVGKIIDTILIQDEPFSVTVFTMSFSIFFVFIWFTIRIIGNIINWQIESRSQKLGALVEANHLIYCWNHVMHLPLSFHKKFKSGAVNQKISKASFSLLRIISDVIIPFIPRILRIIIAFFIMFFINIPLTIVLIIGFILYAAALFFTVPQLSFLRRKMNTASYQAYGNVYDTVANTASVKQATAEKYAYKKLFKDFRLKAVKFFDAYTNVWQRVSLFQEVIITLVQFCIFIISISLIKNGSMTVGELVMFNGYTNILFQPLRGLAFNWNTMHNGLIAISDVEKILQMPKEVYVPKNAVILDELKGEVEFQNVSFAYERNKQKVLDGVSLHIKVGEVVALVGESGVGKSTLIDLMSYYFKPQKGKVLIDGHNVKNLDLTFLRSHIAVVPQEVLLFNDTVKNNIKYGNFGASDKRVEEAARGAHAHDFIEKFPNKYKQIVGERGIKLSSGQKQRIAIARAILRNPKILILDEPTSALDAKSEKFVTEALEKLMKGRTTFIIAHRLATVKKADKIFVLKDRKIAEEGNHNSLIKKGNGIYRELYELQKLG